MITVTFSEQQYAVIQSHLKRRKAEQVAFLFFSPERNGEATTLRIVDYYLVPPEELVFESEWHAEVSEETQARVIKMAWDRKLALGEIHSHPRSKQDASFSPSDLIGFGEFVPHVWWRLRGGPYIALVSGRTDFDALAWISSPKSPEPVDLVITGAAHIPPTGITIAELHAREERERARYSRQETLFGHEGQERLGHAKVAIVGLGGLGSHIAQQLAYLGVRRFSLIDEDRVSRSNLNRLVGATEVELKRSKVDVLKDLILRIHQKPR